MPPHRQLAKDLLPPAFGQQLSYVVHRWRGDATTFAGNYASWEEAARQADGGYAHASILERARLAVHRARNDPDVFERDGTILHTAEYSFPVLAALLWLAQQNNGRLHVVDFGGSLGSSYFQYRRFLNTIPELRWAVVEQPHYVECGQREFADKNLGFHPTIESALQTMRPDVLLASSVLQYLPDPHGTLRQMSQHNFAHILLDRTAFHHASRDRLTLQRNPASLYSASYPAWFFCEPRLDESFTPSYHKVWGFHGSDQVLLANGRPYYRGFLYTRTA